ncbi:MAG TPA: tetratricopeptide repeat protein [Burkholderiales bacterium]|jgi:Tfp pilus assembly protein PilF|nr:tetratricopeptide repeat protein [Burkholderiales bacterium]
MRKLSLVLVLLAGCATPPAPPETRPAQPEPPPVTPAPAPPKENIAVAGLMETARADAASGNLASAAASIERALRIEPRNPRLWHELARVRLKQAQYAQAENVAARSNSWAGEDRALRAENWRLIAESRRARGDTEGAQKALELSNR